MSNSAAVKNLNLFQPQETKTDVCMVKACRDVLISNGAADRIANYDSNPYIQQAANLPWEGQRHLLNNYWNGQLMIEPNKSMEERYSLLDVSTADAWLRIFAQKIIPFCIRYSLPATPAEIYSSVKPA